MEYSTGIIGFIIYTSLYFLPTIIGRKQNKIKSIFLLNFFAGWTIIGWIIAMIWALKKEKIITKQYFDTAIQRSKIEKTHPNYNKSIRVYLSGSHIASRKKYIIKNGWDSMPVELEAEPNNKYDKNAISVKHEEKLIGHIPSDKTHLVHPILLTDHFAQFDSMLEEDSFSNPGETHLTVYLRIFYN